MPLLGAISIQARKALQAGCALAAGGCVALGCARRPIGSTMLATAVAPGGVDELASKCDHSWLKQLTADPEQGAHAPNRTSRQVKSGHYVLVQPTPLPHPRLLMHSPHMAASLGLSEAGCHSEQFARLFSGDIAAAPGGQFQVSTLCP